MAPRGIEILISRLYIAYNIISAIFPLFAYSAVLASSAEDPFVLGENVVDVASGGTSLLSVAVATIITVAVTVKLY